VKINNATSNEKEINYGVVQGGILGSLLFIIFFNQIALLKTNGKLFLYADDAILINSHDKNERIEDKISEDMKAVLEFLDKQQLYLNFEKTNFIIFHSPYLNFHKPNVINLGDNSISRVECVKYLGLLMDEHLKWDKHGEALGSKLASISGILWKLKNKLPQVTKKLIYKSLFETHLNYMSVLYGTACDKVINSIQKIQNRALRNVFNINLLENRVNMYTHQVQNCLPVRAINFVISATYLYNNLSKKIHTNIVFSKVTSSSRTRKAGELIRSQSRTNYGQKKNYIFWSWNFQCYSARH